MTDETETTTTTDDAAAETPAPAPSRTSKSAPAAAPEPAPEEAPAQEAAPAGPDLADLAAKVSAHKGWRLEMQTDAFDRPASPVARHATGIDISTDMEDWEAKLDELNKVMGYAD